jgi:hypothetical protein
MMAASLASSQPLNPSASTTKQNRDEACSGTSCRALPLYPVHHGHTIVLAPHHHRQPQQTQQRQQSSSRTACLYVYVQRL